MVKQYRAKTRKPKMKKTKGKKPTRKINLGKKKKTIRRRRNGGAPNVVKTPENAAIILQSIARRKRAMNDTRVLKDNKAIDDANFNGILAASRAAHAPGGAYDEEFKKIGNAKTTIESAIKNINDRKSRKSRKI